MTRRLVAALVAVLLPLADAAQWAGCDPALDESGMPTMAMESPMPMDDESAPCASDDAGDRHADHDRPCGDMSGDRHDCAAPAPCGNAVAAVAPPLVQTRALAAADGPVWRDQLALGAGSLRPEPPPPRG